MSIILSARAESLLKEISINPQIILDIEGIDLIFGSNPVFKTLFWDDVLAYWDIGLNWDGIVTDEKGRDYISLTGTTNSIGQQIEPDKGSISSISTVNVTLVDKNGEVSRALSFDAIDEILGRKATFSIGFVNAAYPNDAIRIFRGVIVDFYTSAGNIMVTIASPESLKRQVFLEKFQSTLTSAITNVQTTIPVESTAGMYPSQDALKTYLKVEDELMEVVSIDSDTQLTVTRGQLNTLANPHDDETETETFYRLQGRPTELALKIMLSNEGNTYFESLDTPKAIEYVDNVTSIENAVIFEYFNIEDKTGLTVGDTITLNSVDNTGTYTIAGFGVLDNGSSYILTEETLIEEQEYSGGFTYKSKYNTLSTGLGMLTSEVDVFQFEKIESQFSSNFVEYDIYVKDTIDEAKDFIDQEIFFPQGLYSIPRKARSSVKFISPPLSSEIVPYLGTSNILNAASIKQRRSVHKYLYNTFVWRYNVDSLEDKFLTGKIVISSDSIDRINVGKKQMKIDSNGLRNNPSTTTIIDNVSQRLVDRYQFAPTYLEGIDVNYKTGFQLEVGDIVPFGGDELQVNNLQDGKRGSPFSLYEISNKTVNIKTGKITLNLISTAFDIAARYAVVSVASKIDTGSTTTRIKIKTIADTGEFLKESDKWLTYYGQTVSVRDADYSYEYETTLVGVDPSDTNYLIVSPALPLPPSLGDVIEPSVYQGDSSFNERFKIEFCHQVAKVNITSVTSSSVFDVANVANITEGSFIVVNSPDFVRDSFGTKHEITDITGSTVTINPGLAFTPLIGDYVNNSNFGDGGYPYTIL